MANKKKKQNPLIIVGIIVAFFIFANQTGFLGVIVGEPPSDVPLYISSIEDVEISEVIGGGQLTVTLYYSAFGLYGDYEYPTDIYTKHGTTAEPTRLYLTISGGDIELPDISHINITYDVDKELTIYLPRISFPSAGVTDPLHVADDGSTYNNVEMSNLARGAPKPRPETDCQQYILECTTQAGLDNMQSLYTAEGVCSQADYFECLEVFDDANPEVPPVEGGYCLTPYTSNPSDVEACKVQSDESSCSNIGDCYWSTTLPAGYPWGASCISSWSCDSWGACINNLQERTCTDLNSCVADDVQTQSCSVSPECVTSEILLDHIEDWVNNLITRQQLLDYATLWVHMIGCP